MKAEEILEDARIYVGKAVYGGRVKEGVVPCQNLLFFLKFYEKFWNCSRENNHSTELLVMTVPNRRRPRQQITKLVTIKI